MNYLSVIEENFTKADYVAYLRGCILMSLLEDKPLDLPQFKLYADKLVDALEKQPEQPTVPLQIKSFDYTTVDPDEPQVQPKPQYKLGDRVIITYNDFTGTIVRLPMDGVDFPEGYVVQLDNATNGFECNLEHDGVDCYGGWFATDKNLELINEKTLQADKWYHTTDFTLEELQELLLSGTKVEVEANVLYSGIDTAPPTKTKQVAVKNIVSSLFEEKTFIEAYNDSFYREWFKIVQED